MISAPSEILCKPMSNRLMNKKVMESTSGIDKATTMPVRSPSESRLTARTMITASASERANSPMERLTESGWLDTWCRSTPTGNPAWMRVLAASSRSPSAMMSPPLLIETPIPKASRPLKRIFETGGSA